MYLRDYDNQINELKSCKSVYIYGAGDVAREVYFCLSKQPYYILVKSFLVTEINEKTVSNIDGIPVITCNDARVDKGATVIVAVLEKYRDEICNILDENNIHKRILMTFESDLWSIIRSVSFENYCSKNGYPFLFDFKTSINVNFKGKSDCCVYVTRSGKDKPLKSAFELREWEKEVYAGAAVGGDCIDGIRDDEGENISAKNRKYCELTVMYWAWKNMTSEYVGLSHYRRRFDFTNEELYALTDGKIDVIVTTPVVNVPSVKYMYDKNHIADDWIEMKRVVDTFHPEYSDAINEVEKSNFYIPYNMFIMKRSVFNEYSEWLFSILDECDLRIGDKEDVYQNRYIGFMAERLMTVYFNYNKDKYVVLFSNKHFLE